MRFPLIQNRQHTRFITVLALLAIAGLWGVLLVSFPGLQKFPILHDIPLFHYIAQRILSGDVPYRDLVDMNLPGIYLLHVFILIVFGKSNAAWASFVFIWLGLTGLVAGVYSWRISRVSAFFIPALFVGTILLLGIYPFGQRDFLLILFVLLTLHLIANVFEGIGNRFFTPNVQFFLGGVSLGAACSIKPTPIVLVAVLFVLILVLPISPTGVLLVSSGKKLAFSRENHKLRLAFSFLGGVSLLPLLLMFWLLITGGLMPFLSIMLNYNPIYQGLHRLKLPDLFPRMFQQFDWVWILTPLLLVGILFARQKILSPRLGLAFVGLFFGVFHFLFQGKGWAYQTVPFIMFGLLLLALIAGKLLKSSLFAQVTALVWVILISAFLGYILFNLQYPRDPIADLKPAVPMLVADLQTLGITQADQVQVMDVTGGGIHALYLLDHPQATPYIYDFFFVQAADMPFVKHLQDVFMKDLEKSPPRWIVVFISGWDQKETGLARFQSFPQFLQFLKAGYYPQVERPYYIIFTRSTK
jgi:hypothetical protein